jgi:putative ATP-binding cassette transporter
MTIISAFANIVVLVAINDATEIAFSNTEMEARLFLMYLISLILFYIGRKHALSQLTIGLEKSLIKVRTRIAEKIKNTELLFIENVGKSKLYNNLIQDTNLISQSAVFVGAAIQSGVSVLFAFFYIALLSVTGFLLTIITLAIGLTVYVDHHKYITRQLQAASKKEEEFFNTFNHLLDGFKETKINEQKGEDLLAHVKKVSNESGIIKINTSLESVSHIMFIRTLINILLGILAFTLPIFSSIPPETLIKIIATILFVAASLDFFITALPTFDRIDVAVENIQKLEAELETASHHDHKTEVLQPLTFFGSLKLDTVTFQYLDQIDKKILFEVGPLNFSINRGEIIFIIGGNGSGKSTFMKLLTGLYYPQSGDIFLDDNKIDKTNYRAYRSLFSVIFTDFYLFDKLYGLSNIDEKKVKSLLRLMELEKKTKYIDGKFTHTNLSTGQKKRLALIVTMMEDKPIYIFDEWAADQDPSFRQYFYEVLLKDFKNQGKTVIAVTHDDRYFDIADRVLKMDYGKFVE